MSRAIQRTGVNARTERALRPARLFEPGIADAEVVPMLERAAGVMAAEATTKM